MLAAGVALAGLVLVAVAPTRPSQGPAPSPGPPPQVTWDPLARPQREADTIFLPDLGSAAAIGREGGFLEVQGGSPPAATGFQFGPGRFGPAVLAVPGQSAYVFYPVDGLLDADQFTVELWARSDAPWSALETGKSVFAVATGSGNSLSFLPYKGTCSATVGSLDGTPDRYAGSWSGSCDELGLTAGTWHHIGLTLSDQRLTVFVDGRETGSIAGARLLPLWSDGTRADGVQLGGAPGAASGFWISDVRISRTARVPGRPVTLRPVRSTWDVDTNRTLGALPERLVGSLKARDAARPTQVGAAVDVVREGTLLTATPMTRGEPDDAHPTPGRSGRFAYDWQVVDRTLDWMRAGGVEGYLDVDSTPSILGGSVPPYSGERLRTAMADESAYGPEPPDNLDDWAAVVADLVHHVVDERRFAVRRWTVWNEPDLDTAFWNAGRDRYLDLYAVTARAIRSADPRARVGGPELASLDPAWLDALFERAARERLPLDFVSYHDYSGSLATLDVGRATVDRLARQHGFATPFPIAIGELNWTADNMLGTGVPRFRDGAWHLRAVGAAYTTAYLAHLAELPGFDQLTYAHTAFGNPRDGGYASMQLVGPHGEQWAPYNALAGWKRVVQPSRLATAGLLAPGVHGLATGGEGGDGRLGLVLANWGWAQRQARAVDLTVRGLAPGKWLLERWLVDPTHSSRWDAADDGPAGAAHNGLESVERRTVTVGQDGTARLPLTLPQWSSTFVSLVPA